MDDDIVSFYVRGSDNILRCSKNEFQNFRVYSFHGGHLVNIPELLNVMLSSVQELDLSSNYVGKINSTTFERFPKLYSLNLANTSLTVIEPGALNHLKELETLDLSHNNLRHVDLTFLSDLSKLCVVSISNVQVKNVLEIVKLLPPTVEKLNVASNFIGKVNADSFHNLKNLAELDLRKTILFEIETNSFESFPYLYLLELSYNLFTAQFNLTPYPRKSIVRLRRMDERHRFWLWLSGETRFLFVILN